jgi:hypothetical protein
MWANILGSAFIGILYWIRIGNRIPSNYATTDSVYPENQVQKWCSANDRDDSLTINATMDMQSITFENGKLTKWLDNNGSA